MFSSYSTTRRDLENHFSRFGEIDKVDLITDNQGGSRGFGFIAFFSVDVSL
jgi:RNA recognition motif-containing protein